MYVVDHARTKEKFETTVCSKLEGYAIAFFRSFSSLCTNEDDASENLSVTQAAKLEFLAPSADEDTALQRHLCLQPHLKLLPTLCFSFGLDTGIGFDATPLSLESEPRSLKSVR
ncbi:unnamed protein product [Cyclocybe aegerita]|uniref:Uncharacterized protein n=1 Tax=Cyclocybe aegerita TaxID=1973307 RepID=A0A8S0Y0I9_CYCAE|nr:unnamed protein product [Cyclocybe aegerita]